MFSHLPCLHTLNATACQRFHCFDNPGHTFLALFIPTITSTPVCHPHPMSLSFHLAISHPIAGIIPPNCCTCNPVINHLNAFKILMSSQMGAFIALAILTATPLRNRLYHHIITTIPTLPCNSFPPIVLANFAFHITVTILSSSHSLSTHVFSFPRPQATMSPLSERHFHSH